MVNSILNSWYAPGGRVSSCSDDCQITIMRKKILRADELETDFLSPSEKVNITKYINALPLI